MQETKSVANLHVHKDGAGQDRTWQDRAAAGVSMQARHCLIWDATRSEGCVDRRGYQYSG
jgi:hypothetical protein